MKIGQNASLNIQNSLNGNKTEAMKNLQKIATQKEIDATDASNVAIADMLQSEISTASQGVRNANDAIGYLSIADGVLSGMSQGASKLQELSVAMGNGALNSDQRAMIQQEADGVISTMNQSVQGATYNGKNVFQESSFNVGSGSISVNITAPSTKNLELNSDSIKNFMSAINESRSNVGSSMNQLSRSIDNTLVGITNRQAAKSQIADTDMEQSVSDYENASLKLSASVMASVHNNETLQKNIQSLLGA